MVISIHSSSGGFLTYDGPSSRLIVMPTKSRRLTPRHSSQQCTFYYCYQPSRCRACSNPIPAVKFLIEGCLYNTLLSGHPTQVPHRWLPILSIHPFPGTTPPTHNEHPLFSRQPHNDPLAGVYSRPRPGRPSATQPHRFPVSHRWSGPTSPYTSPSFVTDRPGINLCPTAMACDTFRSWSRRTRMPFPKRG